MIEYFLTVGGQIVVMFLMVVVGYAMYKHGMLTERGTKDMSVLLLKVVTPIILMSSFQRAFEPELFFRWLGMFGISALTYAISIVISIIAYRGDKARAEDKMCIFLPIFGVSADAGPCGRARNFLRGDKCCLADYSSMDIRFEAFETE